MDKDLAEELLSLDAYNAKRMGATVPPRLDVVLDDSRAVSVEGAFMVGFGAPGASCADVIILLIEGSTYRVWSWGPEYYPRHPSIYSFEDTASAFARARRFVQEAGLQEKR